MGELQGMTWREKWAKILLLDPAAQVVRKHDKFSVNSEIKIGGYLPSERSRCTLRTIFVSEGSPEEAVDELWEEAVRLLGLQLYLVFDNRRYRYDAFEDNWREIDDEHAAYMLVARQEGIDYRRKLRAEEREQEKIGVPVNLDKYEAPGCDVEPQKKSTINWRAIGGGVLTACKWVTVGLIIAIVWACLESSKNSK